MATALRLAAAAQGLAIQIPQIPRVVSAPLQNIMKGPLALAGAAGASMARPVQSEAAGLPLDMLRRGLQGSSAAVQPTVSGMAGAIGASLAGLLGGATMTHPPRRNESSRCPDTRATAGLWYQKRTYQPNVLKRKRGSSLSDPPVLFVTVSATLLPPAVPT